MRVSANSDVIQQMKPLFEALGPKQFKSAVKSASKRAATTGAKEARKQIPTKWTVKKSEIGGRTFAVKEANGVFGIYTRGKRLSSTKYATRPKQGIDTTGRNRRPVAVQCYSGKSSSNIPNSWLWNRHGGLHLARRPKGSFGPMGGKYKEITGPAVPQLLSSEDIREHVVETMIDTFEKRLLHEYEYRLSKANGGKK